MKTGFLLQSMHAHIYICKYIHTHTEHATLQIVSSPLFCFSSRSVRIQHKCRMCFNCCLHLVVAFEELFVSGSELEPPGGRTAGNWGSLLIRRSPAATFWGKKNVQREHQNQLSRTGALCPRVSIAIAAPNSKILQPRRTTGTKTAGHAGNRSPAWRRELLSLTTEDFVASFFYQKQRTPPPGPPCHGAVTGPRGGARGPPPDGSVAALRPGRCLEAFAGSRLTV